MGRIVRVDFISIIHLGKSPNNAGEDSFENELCTAVMEIRFGSGSAALF